jgi:hypothetical protein
MEEKQCLEAKIVASKKGRKEREDFDRSSQGKN